jgi:transcription initiation factor TFIIIB Brf1 subunit/transcription initiation factor TFIIB
MESKLDMHERIRCHVTSITKYLDRHYSHVINRKAVSWANEAEGHTLLEGKEPLNVAAELVFLAGRQFGIKKLADYIHDETGVSKPYLYNHREEYTRILKG